MQWHTHTHTYRARARAHTHTHFHTPECINIQLYFLYSMLVFFCCCCLFDDFIASLKLKSWGCECESHAGDQCISMNKSVSNASEMRIENQITIKRKKKRLFRSVVRTKCHTKVKYNWNESDTRHVDDERDFYGFVRLLCHTASIPFALIRFLRSHDKWKMFAQFLAMLSFFSLSKCLIIYYILHMQRDKYILPNFCFLLLCAGMCAHESQRVG